MTLLKCQTDDCDPFCQTGRRLEEAANSEVGKELGKVELIIIIIDIITVVIIIIDIIISTIVMIKS